MTNGSPFDPIPEPETLIAISTHQPHTTFVENLPSSLHNRPNLRAQKTISINSTCSPASSIFLFQNPCPKHVLLCVQSPIQLCKECSIPPSCRLKTKTSFLLSSSNFLPSNPVHLSLILRSTPTKSFDSPYLYHPRLYPRGQHTALHRKE